MHPQLTIERTPSGVRWVVSRTVAASPTDAWDLFVDTHRWPDWGPSITAVEASERRIDRGTTGRVRTVGGFWLPFSVTSAGDHRWTWAIGSIPATGHRVSPVSGGCQIAFEVPLLATPYLVVCLLALRRMAGLLEDDTGKR